MILADANLLLYAYNTDSEAHQQAKEWLEDSLNAKQPFGLSWQSITAFLRISTNASAFSRPFSSKEATEIVSEWLSRPQCVILVPGSEHWEILRGLIIEGQATGPLTMDADLAALAIEHGAVLATTDRDFSRFSNLNLINPLEPSK